MEIIVDIIPSILHHIQQSIHHFFHEQLTSDGIMRGLGERLYFATLDGQVTIVQKLLEYIGQDVEALNYQCPQSGFTALHIAAREGSWKIVNELLKYDIDVDLPSEDEMTPLMLAVLNNNVDIAKLLLRHGANINYQTPTDGMTPLHVATQYGHFESIKLLVNNRVNLNHKTKKGGLVALHFACEMGYVQIVKYLIQHGADLEIMDEFGQYPFHHAVIMGQVDTVRLLIKYDYHLVFQSDLEGFKPIHMAIALGYYDISVVLLQTGFVHDPTYVNVKSRTLSTPLMEAILANHVDLVYLLLDYKVDIFATTLLGDNALMTAAASGNTFIVQAILNHIAYEDKEKLLRQVNDDGQDAVLIAASCENSGTLSYLLEYHYQHSLGREVPDNHGRYLMHYISALGDEAATRHVLEQQNHTNAFSKDFFNAYDEDGFTPLCLAAKHNRKEVAAMLLQSGEVNVTKRCAQHTPSQIALLESNFEVALVILEYTAAKNQEDGKHRMEQEANYCTKSHNCTLHLFELYDHQDKVEEEEYATELVNKSQAIVPMEPSLLYAENNAWSSDNTSHLCVCLNCSFPLHIDNSSNESVVLNSTDFLSRPILQFSNTSQHVQMPEEVLGGNRYAKQKVQSTDFIMLQAFAIQLLLVSICFIIFMEVKLLHIHHRQ